MELTSRRAVGEAEPGAGGGLARRGGQQWAGKGFAAIPKF
jgi:hypothetical protein